MVPGRNTARAPGHGSLPSEAGSGQPPGSAPFPENLCRNGHCRCWQAV